MQLLVQETVAALRTHNKKKSGSEAENFSSPLLKLILFFIICVMFTEGGNDIAFGRYFQYMLWLGANKTHKRDRAPAGEWVTHWSEICQQSWTKWRNI